MMFFEAFNNNGHRYCLRSALIDSLNGAVWEIIAITDVCILLAKGDERENINNEDRYKLGEDNFRWQTPRAT